MTAIHLVPHTDGVILHVRASPGARQSGIRGVHDGALKVSVTQAPEKGKANKALITVLSRSLGLRKSQIALVSGETSTQKQFLIRDITQNELAERVRAVLETL